MNFDLSDLLRRVENIVRVGTVSELDEAKARIRVQIGPIKTAWIPWLTNRAGNDRDWWAPEPGEQVVVFSPSGELAAGFAIPAIYTTSNNAPASTKEKHRVVYADGTSVEYDRASHTYHLNVLGPGAKVKVTTPGDIEFNASGEIDFTAPNINLHGNILLDGPLTQGTIGSQGATLHGPLNVTNDVTGEGISLAHHTHGGVDPGGGNTAEPN